MPSKFVADAAEVAGNTFVQPFVAPSDPGNNSAVLRGLAESVIKIDATIKKNQFQTEVEKVSEEFIADQDAIAGAGAFNQLAEQTAEFADGEAEIVALKNREITPAEFADVAPAIAEEQALLARAAKTTAKLKAAARAGRMSETEFKARVETLMKGYINSSPSLAGEFRQIASSTLGFDPTGSRLQAAFSAQKSVSQSKQQSQLELALAKDIQGAGFDTVGLSIEQINNKYGQQYQNIRFNNRMATEQYTSYTRNKTQTTDLALQSAAKSADGRLLDLNVGIARTLGIANNNVITPSFLASLDPKKRTDMALSLEGLKANLQTQILSDYPILADNPTRLMTIFESQFKFIDSTVAMLDGKLSADVWKNQHEFNMNRANAGLSDDPVNASKFAIMQFIRGTGIPSTPDMKIDVTKIYRSLYTAVSNTDGTSNQVKQLGSNLPQSEREVLKKEYFSTLNRAYDSIKDGKEKDPKVIAEIGLAMQGMTSQSWKDPNDIERTTLDAFFNMAKDVEYLDIVKDNKDLKSQTAVAGANYAQRVMSSLLNTITDSDIDTDTISLFIGKDGTMFLDSNSKETNPSNNILLKNLNNRYTVRLNNTSRALAHMSGSTDYARSTEALLSSRNLGDLKVKQVGKDADK